MTARPIATAIPGNWKENKKPLGSGKCLIPAIILRILKIGVEIVESFRLAVEKPYIIVMERMVLVFCIDIEMILRINQPTVEGVVYHQFVFGIIAFNGGDPLLIIIQE